jgi:hypothetical protein
MSTEAATPVAPATEPVPITEEAKPITSEAIPEVAPAAPQKETQDPAAPPSSPLSKLFSELPAIITEAGYGEMWGVQLKDEFDVPTSIVLTKFLRANVVEKKKDVGKAKAQLIEALKWRKKVAPRKLLEESEFDASKFGGLGYVTVYPWEGRKEIVTWNIYGDVKDKQATFGDVEE